MNDILFIKEGKSIVKVNHQDIAYIKGFGNYIQIYTNDEKHYTIYKTLKDVIDKLPNEFMRIHNSFIVNMRHITKIEDNHVHCRDKKIPISLNNRDCFYERIDQYKL